MAIQIREVKLVEDIGSIYLGQVRQDTHESWDEFTVPLESNDGAAMRDLLRWEEHFGQKGIQTRRKIVPAREIKGRNVKQNKIVLEVYQKWFRQIKV